MLGSTHSGEYLPDVLEELYADLGEPQQQRRPMTPETVLANLKRMRLRHGIRVSDVQELTNRQPDGRLTIAEFRQLLHEANQGTKEVPSETRETQYIYTYINVLHMC